MSPAVIYFYSGMASKSIRYKIKKKTFSGKRLVNIVRCGLFVTQLQFKFCTVLVLLQLISLFVHGCKFRLWLDSTFSQVQHHPKHRIPIDPHHPAVDFTDERTPKSDRS